MRSAREGATVDAARTACEIEETVRPVLQGAGAPRAGRALRLAARLPGRAARLHDDRHADMQQAAEAAGRRRPAGHREAPRLQARRARGEAAHAEGRRGPTTCRPRWSRWIRRPATCARWSAAATSTRAASTARCRRKRQPGSAFKPFVYAAALEAGYTPATRHRPTSTSRSRRRRAAGCRRTSTRPPTSMTLRTALRTSSNRAAVQLLQQVGIPNAGQYAQEAGRRRRRRACRRSRSAPAR